MLIQEHDHPLNRALEAYLAGEWLWEGQVCRSAVCINGEGVMHPVGTAAPAALQAQDFEAALAGAGRAEVILVGTGGVQRFLHPRLTAAAAAAGVGVECMNTEAACRTYLLLHSEGRRAWAWLWPAAFR